MKYILTYDLGTTGLKTTLYDTNLNPLSVASENYPLYYPKPGWAEQKPEDFWNAVKKTTQTIQNEYEFDPKDVEAMSFTCQMNCTIPIDKNGEPLMPCISWLDTRASSTIQGRMKALIKFKGIGLKKLLYFKKHTGGGPGKNGKDPISHIMWLTENAPDIYKSTFKFLSVKDYIIFKCTNNAVISKDLGNSSWMMDRDAPQWSDAILDRVEIDKEKLPEIKKSTDIAGKLTDGAAKELNLEPGTPIFVGSGDLTSSALGSGAIAENQVIMCLGTADYVAAHVSERKTDIPHYMGTIHSAQDDFLYISKQETGAACFNWFVEQVFKDKISEFQDDKKALYKYLDALVENTKVGSKNLLFTPWMFGERSPINKSEVRGGFLNLSLEHDRNDLLRALFEGIAFNLNWSLKFIEKALGKCKNISLVGGAANSDIWCQIIADITERNINQIVDPHLGGTRGAAIIAMVGLGLLKSFSEAIPLIKTKKIYAPNLENSSVYRKLFKEFENVYKRNKKMYKHLND